MGEVTAREKGDVLPASPVAQRVMPAQVAGFTSPFSLAVTAQSLVSALKKVFGMPDYAAYLEHCQARHAGDRVLSRSEHYAQHLARRYGNGPSRCC